jgi:hypothetical protein
MDYVPLNIDLIANPFNWVIVVLMIAVAGIGLAFVFPSIVEAKD